jgi:hypothetical protein
MTDKATERLGERIPANLEFLQRPRTCSSLVAVAKNTVRRIRYLKI